MKVLIAGEGGQGVQSAGEVLAQAAFFEEKKSSVIPNFGVEQRGGVSLAFIVIGDEAGYPKFEKADVLAILCDRATERVQRYINSKTLVFAGPGVDQKQNQWLKVENKDLPAKVWNMRVLGEIVRKTEIVSGESLKKSLEEKFAEKFQKDPDVAELNFKAIA